MTDPNEKEIQKTLDEMNKRAEEFQAGKSYSVESSFSSSKLKLILTIVGVIVVLVLSALFYIKSGGTKAVIKPPAAVLNQMPVNK